MADPSLEALLEVQAHDLTIDQLRYRRQALPERVALRDRAATLESIERSKDSTAASIHQLERAQCRLEDDVDRIETKAVQSESRLYGGQVSALKELQALATEVESLRTRKRGQEDELLEVMESIEPLTAELDRLGVHGQAVVVETERLAGALAEQEAEIDGRLAGEVAARANVAARVPDALLARYEKLRRGLDGVGVARVDAGRCTGCHLSLSAVELDSLRRAADGQVVNHEECGRILVP
jgi:predicted  nucleic acid-binding Zn-ribbon protein